MCDRKTTVKIGFMLAAVGFFLGGQTVVQAADSGEVTYQIKAKAISARNIERAAADNLDLRVTRLTPESERNELIKILADEGNPAVAAALAKQDETGWARFDPRGGGGPGRDPGKTSFRYAREIVDGNSRDLILITNEYIGFGSRGEAVSGARLAEFPLSFVLLRFTKDDKGDWSGVGRIFVGARIKYDSVGEKFNLDEFSTDPVYLKNVKIN